MFSLQISLINNFNLLLRGFGKYKISANARNIYFDNGHYT